MSYYIGDRLSCVLENISFCWYLHLRSLLLVIVLIFKRNDTKVYVNRHNTFWTITNTILIDDSEWNNASTTYFEWYGTNIFLGSSSFHTTYTLTLFFDTKRNILLWRHLIKVLDFTDKLLNTVYVDEFR